MMITDTWPRVVPMVMHTVSGNQRAKIATAVLVAILAGGAVGMDVIASQLSSEIAHTDRSQPALVSPNTGFRVASRASMSSRSSRLRIASPIVQTGHREWHLPTPGLVAWRLGGG